MKSGTPLTQGWTLSLHHSGDVPVPPSVSAQLTGVAATVPGCVHTDLMAAGLLEDPYPGTNEQDSAWIGRSAWRYDTVLPAEVGARSEVTELVFDGLDTVARISLDGQLLGETRNMHRSYRFDVTGATGAGALSIVFDSAYAEALRVSELVGQRPNSYPEPFQYLRKMACNFGWDWGPTLVTAGIWRAARLERWGVARLDRVRPQVSVVDGAGRVAVDVDVVRAASGRQRVLLVELTVAGVTATAVLHPGEDSTQVVAEVPDPRLWWPHTLGDQPRYDCQLTLRYPAGEPAAGTGAVLDTWDRRIGFRSVELDTGVDEHGSAFTFVVNGVPIFARGVNWIPDDAFPTRVDAARYRRRLGQAAAAGIDLIRVWGGGIYESEDFYDACDSLGLLVWQDFPFACAAYPEEQPLRGEIEAEARENIARLTPHPSLVLWNGNNENLWGFRDWDWEADLAGASWGEGYYLGLLPRLVAEVDPGRPYWPGSPWSGSWRAHPNDPRYGTSHLWEVWNRRDYTDYLTVAPRFVAEFGWQAPPAWQTLRSVVPDDQLSVDSPAMRNHQKAADGTAKLDRGLAPHFAPPTSFAHWHYLTQVNQARAIATGIEYWRAAWPRCAGTVLWQLNDCWPVVSWSAVDGAGRTKPLYHELRRVYGDRLLTFRADSAADDPDRLVLCLVNQDQREWTDAVTIRRLRADGVELATVTLPFHAAGRAVAELLVPPDVARTGEPASEFLVADAGTLRAWRFAAADRDFAYPEARMTVTAQPTATGAVVTVTAHTLLRDLLLQADRLDPQATANQGLTSLLPGESVTLRVDGWHGGPDELLAAQALWCVNTPGGAVCPAAVQPGAVQSGAVGESR